jgi:hypothetical protein
VTSASAEMQARLLNNARAAKYERLRNEARTRWPELTEDEVADKAVELERDELRRAGRLGAATYQRRAAEQREVLGRRDDLLARVEELATILRSMGGAA